MRPTRPLDLLGVAVVAGVAGWLVVRVAYGWLPPVPPALGLTLLVLAAVQVGLAVVLRGQLERRAGARPLNPILAARSAALAKASSTAGAVLGGVWLGLLVYLLPLRSQRAAAAADTPATVIAVVSALVLVGAGLYLERTLRTPGHGSNNSK